MGRQSKKLTKNDIVGDQGIALIHSIVSEMGYVWNPTGLEAGIDGYIEIRDPVTGEMTNLMIQVQSKATDGEFQAETSDGLDYYCDERDLNYWLSGNAPVVLIRSRPKTKEAYWVSIKDYFTDVSARAKHKIHFDKTKDRFDANARAALLNLALPKDSGTYLSPFPKQEKVYSNMLRVTSVASKIYIAETDYRQRGKVWARFDELGVEVGSEWILKNERIISFYDLEEYPWREVCDHGNIEPIDAEEWATSDDTDILRYYVELLNHSLEEKLKPDVLYNRSRGYFYFAPTKNLVARKIYYQSLVRRTPRTVFQGYPAKGNPDKISYYRHSAFSGKFARYGGQWYLEITPTYRYTWNGYNWAHHGEELLKWIKRRERNAAVLGQVVMWANLLKGHHDLFTPQYPFLDFGSLQAFDIEAGIDDKRWLPNEEKEESEIINSPLNQLPLFELEG